MLSFRFNYHPYHLSYVKFLLLIFTFISSSYSYSQVNPNYHKVKGYYRKDGTYVKPHYRTNRNHTNNDNYSTKPNINPWTGKKGYINPDNKTNYYYSHNYSKTKSSNKNLKSKKSYSKYYLKNKSLKIKTTAKLRTKPSPLGNVIVKIPVNTKIKAIKKVDDYWKVKYGNWNGYLNEIVAFPKNRTMIK